MNITRNPKGEILFRPLEEQPEVEDEAGDAAAEREPAPRGPRGPRAPRAPRVRTGGVAKARPAPEDEPESSESSSSESSESSAPPPSKAPPPKAPVEGNPRAETSAPLDEEGLQRQKSQKEEIEKRSGNNHRKNLIFSFQYGSGILKSFWTKTPEQAREHTSLLGVPYLDG